MDINIHNVKKVQVVESKKINTSRREGGYFYSTTIIITSMIRDYDTGRLVEVKETVGMISDEKLDVEVSE